jgi:hypothetical protein
MGQTPLSVVAKPSRQSDEPDAQPLSNRSSTTAIVLFLEREAQR